jgi:hypothetical protein
MREDKGKCKSLDLERGRKSRPMVRPNANTVAKILSTSVFEVLSEKKGNFICQ